MSHILSALLIIFPSLAFALEARWLGVAGVMLKDKHTTLLIDPVFTKPYLSHWLLNAEFKADPVKVQQALEKNSITEIDGLFISHCHFDHASDVALLSSKFKTPVYGGESLKKIVHHFDAKAPFVLTRNRSEVQIGQFKIKMYNRPHPAIIRPIDWHFLGGKIEHFSSKFYDYREGEVWMFVIEHPEGITIFDQSSILFEETIRYAHRVDNYFLGVSNPEDRQTLVENNIKKISPKRVIPTHQDFFLIESETLNDWLLPTVNLDVLRSEIEKHSPQTKLIVPKKNQLIKLDQ